MSFAIRAATRPMPVRDRGFQLHRAKRNLPPGSRCEAAETHHPPAAGEAGPAVRRSAPRLALRHANNTMGMPRAVLSNPVHSDSRNPPSR